MKCVQVPPINKSDVLAGRGVASSTTQCYSGPRFWPEIGPRFDSITAPKHMDVTKVISAQPLTAWHTTRGAAQPHTTYYPYQPVWCLALAQTSHCLPRLDLHLLQPHSAMLCCPTEAIIYHAPPAAAIPPPAWPWASTGTPAAAAPNPPTAPPAAGCAACSPANGAAPAPAAPKPPIAAACMAG